jgi:hypothetical protein
MRLDRPEPPARGSAQSSLCIVVVAAMAGGALAACSPTVKVEAPDKPIVINLNVKIEQEVRIKVDRDVDSVMQGNPSIF